MSTIKKTRKVRRELTTRKSLLNCMLYLLQFFAKDELCGELSEGDNSCLSVRHARNFMRQHSAAIKIIFNIYFVHGLLIPGLIQLITPFFTG